MSQEKFLGEFKFKMHVPKEQYEGSHGDGTVYYFGLGGRYTNLITFYRAKYTHTYMCTQTHEYKDH